MRKSLELQAELGPVFDVTLDGEDGAPVGGEREHALLMAELVELAAQPLRPRRRARACRSTTRPSSDDGRHRWCGAPARGWPT